MLDEKYIVFHQKCNKYVIRLSTKPCIHNVFRVSQKSLRGWSIINLQNLLLNWSWKKLNDFVLSLIFYTHCNRFCQWSFLWMTIDYSHSILYYFCSCLANRENLLSLCGNFILFDSTSIGRLISPTYNSPCMYTLHE